MPNFRQRNTGRAKELRNEATPPERLLWSFLRNRQLANHKFSRQIPLGPYFCDFVCREKKLIIELDGASHSLQTEHDLERDAYCEKQGYTVLRFSNADVMGNVEGVLVRIEQVLADLPTPNPVRGERRPAPSRSAWEADRPRTRKREGNGTSPPPASGRGPGGGPKSTGESKA